jgi:5-methylcytosine-specific restriction endonuclease McrA
MGNPVSTPAGKRKIAQLIDRQGGICAICGGQLAVAEANLDHFQPVSKGGGGGDNLRAAHVGCNSLKKNYSPQQLLQRATERIKRSGKRR